jgi:hypothetical protein
LKSSQETKQEEENSDQMLTQWEKEFKMMKDWLDNTDTEDNFQKDVVVKIEEEFQPEE